MQIRVRTDIETHPHFDVTYIQDRLEGDYDNLYIILSTLEDELADAWENQGDSFLLIHLPKEKIIDASIDYKDYIIKHLPMLSWLETKALLSYVNERWN